MLKIFNIASRFCNKLRKIIDLLVSSFTFKSIFTYKSLINLKFILVKDIKDFCFSQMASQFLKTLIIDLKCYTYIKFPIIQGYILRVSTMLPCVSIYRLIMLFQNTFYYQEAYFPISPFFQKFPSYPSYSFSR